MKPGDTVYYLGAGGYGDFPEIRKAIIEKCGPEFTHVWTQDSHGETHPSIVVTQNLRTDILDLINDLKDHIKNECLRLEGCSYGL